MQRSLGEGGSAGISGLSKVTEPYAQCSLSGSFAISQLWYGGNCSRTTAPTLQTTEYLY